MDKMNYLPLDEQIKRYKQKMLEDYGTYMKKQPKPTPAPVPVRKQEVIEEPTPEPLVPEAEIVSTPPEEPVEEKNQPVEEILTPEEAYSEFAANNTQTGKIKAQAFTARETYPVPGVDVKISKVFDGGEYVITTQTTDDAGLIEGVSVPAPQKDLSEHPGSSTTPYATYQVTFTHPGFATIVSTNVPVFAGVTAMQTVNMVPVSAAPYGKSTIEYITSEPSDL